MKGLLIKDFRLMKAQKNFFFLIIAISVFMAFTSDDSSFGIAFLGCIGSMFTLSSLSYDEFDNGNSFLFSLPITRKLYVLEKYSFGLIVAGASWILAVVINLLAVLIKNTSSFNEIWLTAFLVLPTIILLLSVMVPFQLKFGGERGKIAIFAAFGILAVIGIIAVKVAELLHIDLSELMMNVSSLGTGIVLAMIIIISLLLMFLSIRISIKIMKKKEF